MRLLSHKSGFWFIEIFLLTSNVLKPIAINRSCVPGHEKSIYRLLFFIIYVGFLVMSNQYLNKQHNQLVTSIFQLSINKLKLTRIMKQKRFLEMDRAQARIAKKLDTEKAILQSQANSEKKRNTWWKFVVTRIMWIFFSKHNADLESPLRDIDFVLEKTNFSKFYIFRFCCACFINHQMHFSPRPTHYNSLFVLFVLAAIPVRIRFGRNYQF